MAYEIELVDPSGDQATINPDDVLGIDIKRPHTALSDWKATIPFSPQSITDWLTSTVEAQVRFRGDPVFRGYLERADSDQRGNQTTIEGKGVGRDLQDIDVEYHALDVDADQAIRDVWALTPYRATASVKDPDGSVAHIDDRYFQDDALTVIQKLHDIAGYRFSIDQVRRDDQALSFSGIGTDDRIDLGTDLGDPQEFTVAFWARPDDLNVDGNNNFRRVVEAGSNFVIFEQSGSVSFRVPGVDTSNFTAGSFDPGDLVHVGCVYDQEDRIIFVDGQEVGRQTIGSGAVNLGALQVGGDGNTSHTFSGPLSGFRMYDRPLGPADFDALLNGRHVAPGLICWLPMTAGSGSTAFGLARQNDGDITGASWADSPVPTARQQFLASVDSFETGTVERTVDFIVKNRKPTLDLYDYANRAVVFGEQQSDGTRPMAEVVDESEIEALGGDPNDWSPGDPAVRSKVRKRPGASTLSEAETEATSLLESAIQERADTGSVDIQPVNVPPGYDYPIDWYGTGNAVPTTNERVEFSEEYQSADAALKFDQERGISVDVVETKFTAQTIADAV